MLSISLAALKSNYQLLASMAAPAQAAAVVKADAYSLGMEIIARALYQAGCRHFFVATPIEAANVRLVLPDVDILVLNGFDAATLPIFINHRLIPVLNTINQCLLYAEAQNIPNALQEVRKCNAQTPRELNTEHTFLETLKCVQYTLPKPWLQLNTGMNRNGLDAIPPLAFPIAGIMSHLACADEPTHPMNAQQLADFKAKTAAFHDVPKSFAATGGVLLGTDYHFQMVRLGAGLYGVYPDAQLQQVITLTAPILEVRKIDNGAQVGYGASYISQKPSLIAVVGCGYADGYPRALSNKGKVSVMGVLCPILGKVSMDSMVVDITHAPKDATQATLYGADYTINDAAMDAGTIGYELATRLASCRLQKVYT
jgi:alanine racemase